MADIGIILLEIESKYESDSDSQKSSSRDELHWLHSRKLVVEVAVFFSEFDLIDDLW